MPEAIPSLEQIPKRKIKAILKDPEKTAKAVNLVYMNDKESSGITRKRKGKDFIYYLENKVVIDEGTLSRIKSLVIPPAWENVWVCALENGHLQATGLDVKQRKQYRYHPYWNALRNHTKFYRLLSFGEALPNMRLQIEKDLAVKELTQRKVLATVISLMERTNIRVGNNLYEKLYGSFGLTTLKDQHVNFKESNLQFSFKGKKGVYHEIELKSKRLTKIVKQCKEIPGKELFQYYDAESKRHAIDSGMVNDYVKEISGADFTTKDFRTWSGTVNAFLAFKEIGEAENNAQAKKNIVAVLDTVAERLGNTRTVCKKYYVHPLIVSLYENNSIHKYFAELEKMETDDNKASLTADEKVVMKILKSA